LKFRNKILWKGFKSHHEVSVF